MKRKSVLVTGGLGFVGSALVRRLVARGARVTVFDNLSRGTRDNVRGLEVKLVVGDVTSGRAVRECVERTAPEVVYHLAAMHFLPDCNRRPVACIRNNVVGTESMLAACRLDSVRRFVAPTSMAVYPICDRKVKETDPVGPYDIYGETKVMNEMQMRRWAGATGKTAVAVRLANVYGPRETNPHVLPVIMEQLSAGKRVLELGNTKPYRDYIHSEDAARAFEAMGSCPRVSGYQVFNLGTGKEHSVDELLVILGQLLKIEIGVKVKAHSVRKIERMHLWPDIGKLRRVTGWRPEITMRDGLAELCREYGLQPRRQARHG
ncbi:MAG: NAD-dependent epimerase/dehydratase family protein [Lentisphaerae bacterium]|nr:NAD-dependent epimerase/dehydratase family protein [Lentisphaerota bacterium]